MKTRSDALAYVEAETDRRGGLSQRARILRLLLSANEIGLPELLDLRVSQYNARISELRARGFEIQNRTEHKEGIVHSWFRLVTDSAPKQIALPLAKTRPIPQGSDWYTESTGRARV